MNDIITQLTSLLTERKSANPDSSYVASLYAEGINKILEKVGEEATEVILAAKDAKPGENQSLIHETADLWFHTLVMLIHLNIDPNDILQELNKRFGTSGITEKASRNK